MMKDAIFKVSQKRGGIFNF